MKTSHPSIAIFIDRHPLRGSANVPQIPGPVHSENSSILQVVPVFLLTARRPRHLFLARVPSVVCAVTPPMGRSRCLPNFFEDRWQGLTGFGFIATRFEPGCGLGSQDPVPQK